LKHRVHALGNRCAQVADRDLADDRSNGGRILGSLDRGHILDLDQAIEKHA